MNINEVEFPIYKMGEFSSIETEEGVTVVVTSRHQYILDDKNYEGSFGYRRRQIVKALENINNINIYPLRHMFEGWWQVVAQKVVKGNYVDSKGDVFFYKPSKFYNVVYYKLKNQAIVDKRHTLLYIDSFLRPFKVPRPLPMGTCYCGVIQAPLGNFIVDISSTKKVMTRKKL